MPEPTDSVQPHSHIEQATAPTSADFSRKHGKVYLVGAGPGDPRLITWRGTQCLERADVILYDGLANPQLLRFGARAELISVGKHGKSPIWTQDKINSEIVRQAKQGRVVVRLKGGDPAVFARTAEELEVLCEHKIPFEVVPGITAALAAASYVGIPITHRHHASAVAFITGQQQRGGVPQHIDWQALANFPGTLVFYMGVTTVASWTQNLLAAGKDSNTPTAIVRRCSWSDQAVIRCRLEEVASQLTPASKLRPPVIVVIGDVAALGEDFDWFSKRPLHGCGILVTRPIKQSQNLTDLLQELGADVFHQPCISIAPASNNSSLQACFEDLKHAATSGHGITFSSSNGVHHFFEQFFQSGLDSRALHGVVLACVGPATAESLRSYGLQADLMPPPERGYNAQSLLKTILQDSDANDWFVTTTNESQNTLTEGLGSAGKTVHPVLTYETKSETELLPDIRYALEAGRIQLCTITSTAIARSAAKVLGEFKKSLQPVALSQGISATLEELGWPAACIAEQNSDQNLVSAITSHWTA